MGNVLALDLLFDGIVAVFAADAAPNPSRVSIVFGWREVAKQINQGPGGANRIVIHPGLPGEKTGRFGSHMPVHKPGRNPRSLATRIEIFTAYIWAVDGTDETTLRNERAQWRAARMLYDAFDRAAYLVTHTDGDVGVGPVTWLAEDWNLDKSERGYGAEVIVSGAVESMVPDTAFADVTDAHGVVAVTLRGETNTVITET